MNHLTSTQNNCQQSHVDEFLQGSGAWRITTRPRARHVLCVTTQGQNSEESAMHERTQHRLTRCQIPGLKNAQLHEPGDATSWFERVNDELTRKRRVNGKRWIHNGKVYPQQKVNPQLEEGESSDNRKCHKSEFFAGRGEFVASQRSGIFHRFEWLVKVNNRSK